MINEFIQVCLTSFFSLLPIVNPIGNTPIFLAITEGVTIRERHRLSRRTAVYVFATLTFFLLIGGSVLRIFGISLDVVRIAGGIMIFHAAWGMLNGNNKISASEHKEAQLREYVAFFPMTMPLLAGPGAIAVTLSLAAQAGNHSSVILLLVNWFAAITAIAGIAIVYLISLRAADGLFALLGETGTRTLTRIFGFLILAVGVQLLLNGLAGWLSGVPLKSNWTRE
jgi:multiple antibiotic resistance protein